MFMLLTANHASRSSTSKEFEETAEPKSRMSVYNSVHRGIKTIIASARCKSPNAKPLRSMIDTAQHKTMT